MIEMEIDSPILDALTWLLPLMVGIILHELGHAWAAYRLGDSTAKDLGRLTLNPLAHIHPIGTIVMPLALLLIKAPIMFGYAKPVPIVFSNLRRVRLGMALVAAAGPAANIVVAFMAVMLLRLEAFITPEQMPWFYTMLYRAIILNLTLAFFNLIPIYPLDGGRILYSIFPGAARNPDMGVEVWGIWGLVLLLILPVFGGPNIMEPLILAPTYVVLGDMLAFSNNDPMLIIALILLIIESGLMLWRRRQKNNESA